MMPLEEVKIIYRLISEYFFVLDLLVSIFYEADRKHSLQVIFLLIFLLIYALFSLVNNTQSNVTNSDCLCSTEVQQIWPLHVVIAYLSAISIYSS
jgi:hypothetical protein